LVASAVMVALVGLLQYFWLDDVITAEGGIRRLRSLYGSPNNVGLYLGRVLPLLVAIVFGPTFCDQSSSSSSTKEAHRTRCFPFKALRYGDLPISKRRVLYALAIGPVTLALLLSFSRGAIILGIPAALLTLGLFAGKTWRRVTLVLLCLGVLAMIPILQLPRFAGLFDWSAGTTGFRISLWFSSIQMIRESPLFGVGLDNFLYAYRSRYVLPTAWEEFNLSHPHNVFLDFATRLGLPGLCLFLWMQYAFWRNLIPHLKSQRPEIRVITLGMMASMVNFLAHGLVDASYFVIDLAYVYMLSCAVTVWIPTWNIEKEGEHENAMGV
jgi:O-antigen ligase